MRIRRLSAAFVGVFLSVFIFSVLAPSAEASDFEIPEVTLCHNGETKTLPLPAAIAHFLHGDERGPCESQPEPSVQCVVQSATTSADLVEFVVGPENCDIPVPLAVFSAYDLSANDGKVLPYNGQVAVDHDTAENLLSGQYSLTTDTEGTCGAQWDFYAGPVQDTAPHSTWFPGITGFGVAWYHVEVETCEEPEEPTPTPTATPTETPEDPEDIETPTPTPTPEETPTATPTETPDEPTMVKICHEGQEYLILQEDLEAALAEGSTLNDCPVIGVNEPPQRQGTSTFHIPTPADTGMGVIEEESSRLPLIAGIIFTAAFIGGAYSMVSRKQ